MKKFTIIMVVLIVFGSIMIKSQVEEAGQNIVRGVVPWVRQVGDNIKDLSGNVVKEYDWAPRIEKKTEEKAVEGSKTEKTTTKDVRDSTADYRITATDNRVPSTVITRERIIERQVPGTERIQTDGQLNAAGTTESSRTDANTGFQKILTDQAGALDLAKTGKCSCTCS